MKLVIKDTCVVGAGKIVERGSIYETGNDDPTSDKLAFDLISNGRALPMELHKGGVNQHEPDPEAEKFLADFAAEKAQNAKRAAALLKQ